MYISQNLAKKILPSLVKTFNSFSNLGRCQVFVWKNNYLPLKGIGVGLTNSYASAHSVWNVPSLSVRS